MKRCTGTLRLQTSANFVCHGTPTLLMEYWDLPNVRMPVQWIRGWKQEINLEWPYQCAWYTGSQNNSLAF